MGSEMCIRDSPLSEPSVITVSRLRAGQVQLPDNLKKVERGYFASDGRASVPISSGGVDNLRNLILRTLNDNQLLVLNAVSERDQSLTSTLKQLSEEYGIPLSTLKLNARILRELKLISYGSIHNKQSARLENLGSFVVGLVNHGRGGLGIQFSD